MKKRGTSLLGLPGSLRPPLARSQTSPNVAPKERYSIREMACGLSTVVYVDDETMHLDILNPYVNKDTTLLAVSTPQLLTTRSTYRLMKSANTFKLNFPGSSPQENAKSPRALSPSGRPRGGKFMALDITSLLHGAVIGGDTKLVKSILIQEYESSSGTGRLDLNCTFLHNSSSSCTILHTAAKYNRTDIIEFVLSKDKCFIANLEATDNLGATPLV
jgi:ankyrin repeat protein